MVAKSSWQTMDGDKSTFMNRITRSVGNGFQVSWQVLPLVVQEISLEKVLLSRQLGKISEKQISDSSRKTFECTLFPVKENARQFLFWLKTKRKVKLEKPRGDSSFALIGVLAGHMIIPRRHTNHQSSLCMNSGYEPECRQCLRRGLGRIGRRCHNFSVDLGVCDSYGLGANGTKEDDDNDLM